MASFLLDFERSETSVPCTISGNLSVRCVLLLCWFILTPFHWPRLGTIFNRCWPVFSCCIVQVTAGGSLLCRFLTFSHLFWTDQSRPGWDAAGEWAWGLRLFQDFITTKDDWKVRKYLEKVLIWVHWCIDSCNVVVRFWLLQLYLFTFQLSCLSCSWFVSGRPWSLFSFPSSSQILLNSILWLTLANISFWCEIMFICCFF